MFNICFSEDETREFFRYGPLRLGYDPYMQPGRNNFGTWRMRASVGFAFQTQLATHYEMDVLPGVLK